MGDRAQPRRSELRRHTVTHTALLCLLLLALVPVTATMAQDADTPDWEDALAKASQLYGHRNWICIVDSAYPAQSAPGITTIATGEDHFTVVQKALSAVADAPQVRPIVYVDKELAYVPEAHAKGIRKFRKDLDKVLEDRDAQRLPHEDIIAKLDEAAETFQILILKTDLVLPYTSVFLQLDCGYWSADGQAALEAAIEAGQTDE